MDPAREPLPTRVEDTAPLPAAYHGALESGLAALGLELDAAARAAVDGHVRLLLAWTGSVNLTAIREPAAAALGHVVDSLAGVAVLRRLGVGRFLDLGSGGGFPGLPLAAALPATQATLVEAVGKKARFLSVAAAATGLDDRVRIETARSEAIAADPSQRGRWPAVTARAVAASAELIELAFPLLEQGGSLVAWKRGRLDPELAAAERALAGLGGGRIELIPVPVAGLQDHALVVATRTGAVPAMYPRDPASRKRRPW